MNPRASSQLVLPESYSLLLRDMKTHIRASQTKAAQAVNRELIQLYWWIGSEIVKRQKKEGWRPRMMDRFCKDLQSSFPGDRGFSEANLLHMRTFYLSYAPKSPPEYCFTLPWGHHIILMGKVKNLSERESYACKAIENGWSRETLVMQIESGQQHKTKN